MKIRGTLIPIGGNEDKGLNPDEKYSLDFIEEGILSIVVREGGGTDSKIVVIPTASSIPVEVGENYKTAFAKLGCQNVSVLDIREEKQAWKEDFIKQVAEANTIMFSGGDQSRIIDIIGQSPIHKVLQERFEKEPIVIAGTSAGAMAMSTEMIAGGSVAESLQKGSVRMREGLGLLPELIVDSHFITRGRFGRLAEAVAKFPKLLGIGLAEDTGMIIKNCNEFTVIGSGMVILFDPSQLHHNNEEVLDPGTPMSMTNLIVHVLSNGDRFVIDERKLEVLPLEESFIN